MFGPLQCALGEPARAAQATERVYRQLWRAAPHFDPATGDAYALLLRTARRELIGPLRELVTDGRAEHHAVPVDRNDISPEPSSNSDTGPAGRDGHERRGALPGQSRSRARPRLGAETDVAFDRLRDTPVPTTCVWPMSPARPPTDKLNDLPRLRVAGVGLLAISLPLPWMAMLIANDAPARRTEDTHRLTGAAPSATRNRSHMIIDIPENR